MRYLLILQFYPVVLEKNLVFLSNIFVIYFSLYRVLESRGALQQRLIRYFSYSFTIYLLLQKHHHTRYTCAYLFIKI